MSKTPRIFKKVVVHENIKKNFVNAIQYYDGKVESKVTDDKRMTTIRFSATKKNSEELDQFFKDRMIKIEEYTPRTRV